MKALVVIKFCIHRILYWGSTFLPLRFLWKKLHSRYYHPRLDEIKNRISRAKLEPSSSIFVRWSAQLNQPLNLMNKKVLEIGHGGAWYLAQALDEGASYAVGYEISDELNQRAYSALWQLGYRDFELITGNGKDLDTLNGYKFDLIYSVTVLQHLPTRTTKRYLCDAVKLLNDDGFFVVQTLHSYGKSMKRVSVTDLFSVAYSEKEFALHCENAGLKQVSFARENYESKETYWGIYLLTK